MKKTKKIPRVKKVSHVSICKGGALHGLIGKQWYHTHQFRFKGLRMLVTLVSKKKAEAKARELISRGFKVKLHYAPSVRKWEVWKRKR